MDLRYTSENAAAILDASPVQYVKESKPRGSLFHQDDTTGLVCGVDSKFLVDHAEILEVLKEVKPRWPLGDLPDGHEFLLIFPVKHRRSR